VEWSQRRQQHGVACVTWRGMGASAKQHGEGEEGGAPAMQQSMQHGEGGQCSREVRGGGGNTGDARWGGRGGGAGGTGTMQEGSRSSGKTKFVSRKLANYVALCSHWFKLCSTSSAT
jgi:hypothetical protein